MPSLTTMAWLTEARAQYFEQRCCPQSQWTTSLLKTQARFYYTTHSSDRLDDDRQFATVCKNSAWPTCGTQGRTSERTPVLDKHSFSNPPDERKSPLPHHYCGPTLFPDHPTVRRAEAEAAKRCAEPRRARWAHPWALDVPARA